MGDTLNLDDSIGRPGELSRLIFKIRKAEVQAEIASGKKVTARYLRSLHPLLRKVAIEAICLRQAK